MQTFLLFATIIIAVILMVLAISKLKMHPFIVMLVIAMVVGLFWGIVDPDSGLTPTEVVNQVKNGFGSIMTSIGIVILCGTIIGTILEKTGAALTMANAILKLVPHQPCSGTAVQYFSGSYGHRSFRRSVRYPLPGSSHPRPHCHGRHAGS